MLWLIVFALFSLTSLAGLSAPAARPNILFLFTDDQRPDAVRALGNPAIQTPHLDRLVHSGLAFTNAYCMGSTVGAVCLPSRTMLMTGMSLFRIKKENARGPTFPASMREAGYVTYHHGKKSNTPRDVHQLFEYTHYLSSDRDERRSGQPGKEIADKAVAFLRRHTKEKPFFMYLAFGNPHDPRVVQKDYRDQYDEQNLPLPKNYLPLHRFDNGEMTNRDEQLAAWPRTEQEIRRHLADYYGVITYLDMQIGRVVETLKEIGEYNNTIIIFSSDHGLAIGSHGLMGKQSLYEHSMKAPLVFVGPGIRKGRSDAFVYLFDLYPTVCELVGAGIPEGIEGRSFASILQGKATRARDAIFLAYKSVQRAVRQGNWKLIRYPHLNHTQLFDLGNDPHELYSLADSDAHQEKIRALTALLKQQQQQFGDTVELISSNPQPKEVSAAELNRRAQNTHRTLQPANIPE